MFSGYIFCKDCGSAMRYNKRTINQKLVGEFICGGYKRKGKDFCSTHYILYQNVYNILFADIRSKSLLAIKNEKRFIQSLEQESQLLKAQKTNVIQKDMDKAKSRVNNLDRIISNLYEDKALGNLPQERFNIMLDRFETEHKELSGKIGEAEKILKKHTKNANKILSFTELIKEVIDITEITPDILSRLVKKIEIGHATKNPVTGEKQQEINIEFAFCA